MKTASAKELKIALKEQTPQQLLALCLRLAVFKKENKELLTYLLFEAEDEESYRSSIKVLMDTKFDELYLGNYYYLKKNIRAILKEVKKYIRYSKSKETEVELLIYFLRKMSEISSVINRNRVLTNIFERQLDMVNRKIESLHEDLQFDYKEELREL